MEKTVIKPTVGRVVWYWPYGFTPGQQPQAAIVAHVHSDRLVNLAIFDPNGCPMLKPPTSVKLVQEGDEEPTSGNYCSWMPFQTAQAKKYEAEAEATKA